MSGGFPQAMEGDTHTRGANRLPPAPRRGGLRQSWGRVAALPGRLEPWPLNRASFIAALWRALSQHCGIMADATSDNIYYVNLDFRSTVNLNPECGRLFKNPRSHWEIQKGTV